MISTLRFILSASLFTAGFSLQAQNSSQSSSSSANSSTNASSTSTWSNPNWAPTDQPMFGQYWPAHPHNGSENQWTYQMHDRALRPGAGPLRVPLPPVVPALAQPDTLPWFARGTDGSAGLAGEVFYMGYVGLAGQQWLSPGRAQRVRGYLGKRTQLVAELREQLKRVETQTTPDRASALADLNAKLEPACLELEQEAETIRYELTARTLWRATVDQGWLPEPFPNQVHETAIYRAVSGAQFYEGLSAEQRELLTEIALEHRLALLKPEAAGVGYTFFLPATSRIRLPAELPEPVRAKIARLTEAKTVLKEELMAAVSAERHFFLSTRMAQLQALQAKQAQRYDELEAFAEEIRRDLSSLNYPDAPLQTGLPPALNARAAAALARKAEIQRELRSFVALITQQLPSRRVGIAPAEYALQIEVKPESAAVRPGEPAGWRDDLVAFNARLARSYAELATEMDAVRSEVKAYAHSQAPARERNIARLTSDFSHSFEVQERWARYHDYHAAVLMPGLTPAIRRVLFKAALADLLAPAAAPTH